jgi:2-phosphosulfolactate phosphatase
LNETTRPRVEIRKATLEDCGDTVGPAVVVDVLRAFTTTAFAFARGAAEITLVSSIEEAFTLRAQDPELLLMGEVRGLAVAGFDLPNSPYAIDRLDLHGRRLAMRTTAGTQGVVLTRQARPVYVASLCVAAATARAIAHLQPRQVTFVETGRRSRGGGEEDVACADAIAALLHDAPLPAHEIRTRVRTSSAAAKFTDDTDSDFAAADLEYALRADCFEFAMKVEPAGEQMVLRPVEAP